VISLCLILQMSKDFISKTLHGEGQVHRSLALDISIKSTRLPVAMEVDLDIYFFGSDREICLICSNGMTPNYSSVSRYRYIWHFFCFP